MSDGGDGFGEILSRLFQAQTMAAATVDAAHRPIDAAWWWNSVNHVAIIESARVVGLAMLPHRQFNPTQLDTFGLGAVLRAAARQGAGHCLIGIGGSATNDGGFGLARALGWQFLAGDGSTIARWTELDTLSSVRPPDNSIHFDELIVGVDVQNPLLGPTGCSRVYGPQKGLVDFDRAERALGRLATVMAEYLGVDVAAEPGAGAAGGLGFGLRAFAGARLEPGIDIFKRYAKLDDRVHASQLVVTGEGAIDAQTLMGKGVGEIARLCAEAGVPCLGVAGFVADKGRAQERFHATYALTPDLTDRQSALREPALWLEYAAANAARQWSGEQAS